MAKFDEIIVDIHSLEDQFSKIQMAASQEAQNVKSLKAKVYTNSEQIQEATNHNKEFLENTKHLIQLQFSQQERKLLEEIHKTDTDTRSVVFQKIYDSILLCSKKEACCED